MTDIHRRRGSFWLAGAVVRDDPGLAQTLYSEVIPIQMTLEGDGYRVFAFSLHFEPIDAPDVTPQYCLSFVGGRPKFER